MMCFHLLPILFVAVSASTKLFLSKDQVTTGSEDYFYFRGYENSSVIRSTAAKGFFGYSVAAVGHFGQAAIVVGAPKTAEGGAAYLCDFQTRKQKFPCSPLPLKSPPGVRGFFGGTVAAVTADKRGFALICDHLFSVNSSSRPHASGLCNLREVTKDNKTLIMNVCNTADCMSGFSVDMMFTNPANLHFAMGSPSLSFGLGTARVGAVSINFSQNSTPAFGFSHRGGVSRSYLTGYSIGFGKEIGGDVLFVSTPRTLASSAPRVVEVFKLSNAAPRSLLTRVRMIPEPNFEAISGQFGFAVLAIDFTPGDETKQSSLLVADPFLSFLQKDLVNAGAVYLFCRLQNDPKSIIIGPESGGLFGHAMTALDDLNGDRVPDFAIGCPYCDEGRGSVLVFAGNRTCHVKPPFSVLKARELSQIFDRGPLNGLGWSLDGSQDFDGNDSPDLIIGAALNDSVVLIRSRSVLKVECQVLKEKCRLSYEGTGKCSVNFIYKIDFPGKLPLNINIDYDARKQKGEKRMVDWEKGQPVISYETIQSRTILVKAVSKLNKMAFDTDVDTPIVWNATITVSKTITAMQGANGLLFPPPFLSPKSCSFQPKIQNENCGTNCITDIGVHLLKAPEKVVFPTPVQYLRLLLAIDKNLKDALRARIRLRFHNGVRFGRMNSDKSDEEFLPSCKALEEDTNVVCFIGLVEEKRYVNFSIDFTIAWHTGWLLSAPPQMEVEVLTSNIDKNGTNNHLKINFEPDYRPNVTLTTDIDSNLTVVDHRKDVVRIRGPTVNMEDIGPRLHHVYQLSNYGPSPALGVVLQLEVPLFLNDLRLLYLVPEVNTEDGSITTGPRIVSESGNSDGLCKISADYMNPLQLTVYSDDHTHQHSNRSRKRIKRSSSMSGPYRCPGTGCVMIYCRIERLEVQDVARVILDAWLWSITIEKEQLTDVRIESRVRGAVEDSPSRLNFSKRFELRPLNITTNFVFPNLRQREDKRLPEIYIWSILGGLVLLAIIIFLLYKCHFFERKRSQLQSAKLVTSVEMRKESKAVRVSVASDSVISET